MVAGSGGDAADGGEQVKISRMLVWPKRVLAHSGQGLIYLGLASLVCFIASNLWLMSPWGTNTAEKKLSERLGLECKIGSMTWSPWNGVTVKRMRMFMPGDREQAVADIERVVIMPYWKPLLRRQLRLREVVVNQPRIELAIEMLTALPADTDIIDRPPIIPPVLAANQVKPLPKSVALNQTKKLAQEPESQGVPTKRSLADYANVEPRPVLGSQVLTQQKPSQAPAVDTAMSAQQKPSSRRPPAGSPMRLRVKEASIRFFSMSKELDLLNVNELSMDLPLSGEDSDGFIKVAGIKIPNVVELPDIKQKVVWKRPRLEIEEQELDVGFAKINMRVQLGVKNSLSHLPFLVDMAIKPQQVDSVAWLEQQSMHASAGLIVGRFRLLGLLDEPLGWKADGVFAGEGVTVQAGEGRPRVTFDTVFIPIVLHRGNLHWLGFKMLGEDFSMLGNGRLSMRGGVVCVTRLVASPEVAEVMEKSLSRAGLVDTRWWYDMYTPDRKVRDLIISGDIRSPLIDVGPKHARLPLSHLLHLILNPGVNKIPPKVPADTPQSDEAEPEEISNEEAVNIQAESEQAKSAKSKSSPAPE